MCAPGCGCVPITGVMCPQGGGGGPARCIFPGDTGAVLDGRGTPVAPAVPLMACPAGCVPGPAGPIPDPCNSCTVTNAMVDMMVSACPGSMMGSTGRKKKRAILESQLFDGFNISPSPSSQSDIER